MNTDSTAPQSARRSLVRMVALALLCGLVQALQPAYEIGATELTPLSLVLGVTVAAAVARGRWTVLAALAGVLAADALTGQADLRSLVGAGVLALQAVTVGWMLRHGPDPQVQRLDDQPRLRRFVLIASPLAALIGVVVHGLLDVQSAAVTPRGLAAAAIARFVADWAGVVVVAPVLLCWLGRPPEPWRPRRRLMAVPLVLLSAVMLVGVDQVARRDEGRLQSRFDRDATARQIRVANRLTGPLSAALAMRGVLAVGGSSLSPAQFDVLAAPWIEATPGLQALGWAVRQPKGVAAASDPAAPGAAPKPPAAARAAGVDAATLATDSDQVVVRHAFAVAASGVVRHTAGPDSVGINAMGHREARQALQRALVSEVAVVTPAFVAGPDADPETRVMVMQALPAVPGGGGMAAAVVFATVATDKLMAAVLPDADDPSLRACLTDTDDKALVRRLAGPPNCDTELRAASARSYTGRVDFGDKRLALRITEPPGADGRMFTALWLLALPAAIGGAMLSTLLLALSGRLQRIEDRVRERTAALQSEVDERRRAQSSMADSEQRFRAIFEGVTVGVALVDSGGRLAMVNPAFCAMTGYGDTELVGRPLSDIRLPDVVEDDGTAAALGGLRARRQRFLTKDGHILQVAANLRELRDAGGRSMGTIGVLQDLTEMLRLRDAEREHQQVIAADRLKSDFLARLGTELRAPLNAIINYAQALSGTGNLGHDPAQQGRALAQIRQNGWQLLEMVNDLLDLSRIEAGQLRVGLEAVPLAELIQETAALCESQARDQEVSLRLVLSPAADWVQADPARLRQVLTHLIVNGIRYNRRGGQVELRTRLQDASVLIEIEDDGLGLSESQLELLFTPFHRLGREQLVPHGTGIGLVICRRLLALMHGELLVKSRAGEGSVFTVTLPRAMLFGAAQPSAPAPFIAQPVSIGRVLCILGNRADADALRELLKQRPGVELVHADDAATGLVQARDADLVLLDLEWPDRPGLELLRALKADARTRRTPVVVVASQAQPANIEDCIEAGAANFLIRPFESAPTLRAIDAGLASI